ncbi:MAG: GxxExxY protein, partial [Candidatus Micrarchaeia archaeon]
MKKFFIFLSHPIHYHTSIYKILAQNKDLDLVVYFYSDFGLGKHIDPQFKTEIDFDKEDILQGYKYVFLKNLSKVKNFKFFDFINYEIPKIIWKEKPDYVLINSWSYFSDWLVVVASLFSKTKLCLRSENPLCHEAKKPKWKIWIKKIILGFLFKQVDIFFYIGKENKEFLKFYGADESKMIFTPYAVDNDYFQKEYEKLKNKKEELRKELGIGEKDIVILFVGKLIPKKRPMDLLKAYETVIRNIRMRPNMTNNIRIIEKDLSYKLNGLFFEIHKELGRFAREKQYADLLEEKLKNNNIKFKREIILKFNDRIIKVPDFIIEDKILVELKRKPVNTKDDYKRIIRYLEITGLELGILVNFGLEYLKPRRILNYKLLRNRKSKYPSSSANSDNSYHSDYTSKNSDYGIHLIFVGDGPLRQELEDHTKKLTNNSDTFVNSDKFVHSDYGIHFVGFQSQKDLPKYYTIADIFVLPSDIGETWGLVVNEAMNFGLPVIVSDMVGCGPDLVKSEENGFIFKTGDIEELKNYLLAILNGGKI